VKTKIILLVCIAALLIVLACGPVSGTGRQRLDTQRQFLKISEFAREHDCAEVRVDSHGNMECVGCLICE
jgi:hypothetical protein